MCVAGTFSASEAKTACTDKTCATDEFTDLAKLSNGDEDLDFGVENLFSIIIDKFDFISSLLTENNSNG